MMVCVVMALVRFLRRCDGFGVVGDAMLFVEKHESRFVLLVLLCDPWDSYDYRRPLTRCPAHIGTYMTVCVVMALVRFLRRCDGFGAALLPPDFYLVAGWSLRRLLLLVRAGKLGETAN
jgi:hypothetical protein